jgi:hypothetical protein
MSPLPNFPPTSIRQREREDGSVEAQVTRAPEQSAAVIEVCRKKSAVGAHTTEVKSTRARSTALSAVTPKCRCSP